jgi:hypothetical protein
MRQPRGDPNSTPPGTGGNNGQSPLPHTHLLSGVSSSHSETLYHPSIFRYSCRGRLSLDSRNGGKSQHSAGVCRGVQSQLEHIDQWRTMTRDDAISIFQNKTSDYFGDADKDAGINPLDPAAAGPSTPTSSGGPSSEGGAHAQALHAVYLSNVLVYPSSEDDDDKKKKSVSKNIPITTPELEEWRCYGTTEVDLLVLRPDNGKGGEKNADATEEEETIAAVAPYTAPGMQVRDLTTNAFGKERTRTIRLGILEIVYSTAMDAVEDAEEDSHNLPNQPNRPAQQQDNHKKDPNTKRHRRKSRTEEEEDDDPKLSTPARIYQSAQNIAKHMEINAKLVYESTQDNFPERTIEAGKRIYEELPHTLDRTIEMMKKMLNSFGNGDDNDDDDHDRPSGRPGRR